MPFLSQIRSLRLVGSILLLVCSAFLASVSARAASVAFTGADSTGRAASATFSLSSGILTIALDNTSTNDAMNATDMLTALFFNINGVTLTPVSATLGPNSVVIDTRTGGIVTIPNNNVGGEWGYGSGFNVAGSNKGTSSSGFGIFSNPNFNGQNLQGPTALDGIQYGITTAGDIAKTGNGGITSNQSSQFIKNEVILTLTALPTSFSLSLINDVRFQYGTALTDPYLTGTPTGGGGGTTQTPDGGTTAVLLGLGLLGVEAVRRKLSR